MALLVHVLCATRQLSCECNSPQQRG